MPVGERQRQIVEFVVSAVECHVTHTPTFKWLRNVHRREDFSIHLDAIDRIFTELGGSRAAMLSKRQIALKSDALLGEPYKCLLEFDEFQHFSSARAKALTLLPTNISLGFSKSEYLEFCRVHCSEADQYRRNKKTAEFDFAGGRTAQRAYFDCFRDLLPVLHNLRPTIRIAEFEVEELWQDNESTRVRLRRLIEEKVGYTI